MKFKLREVREITVSVEVEANSETEAWHKANFIPFEAWDIEAEDILTQTSTKVISPSDES